MTVISTPLAVVSAVPGVVGQGLCQIAWLITPIAKPIVSPDRQPCQEKAIGHIQADIAGAKDGAAAA